MGDTYVIRDGCLKVNKELCLDYGLSFDKACAALLNSPARDLTIDISSINQMNSTYIGIMAAAFFQAKSRDKTLSIAAGQKMIQLLRLSGFEEFISLKEVESPGADETL